MTTTQERLRKTLTKQGMRFSRTAIPDDVFAIIKDRQRKKEMEIKNRFSMESTVYMIIRESAKK